METGVVIISAKDYANTGFFCRRGQAKRNAYKQGSLGQLRKYGLKSPEEINGLSEWIYRASIRLLCLQNLNVLRHSAFASERISSIGDSLWITLLSGNVEENNYVWLL